MTVAIAPAILIWPWGQRLLHWFLAACVIAATWTHEGGAVHEAAGYGALAAALARIALGLCGPDPARFAAFVRGWRTTWHYAKAVWRHDEHRYVNHNPLGAWMTATLLTLAALGALSGWLYTTERYWGEAWVINLHAALSWPFVLLVPLHLAGVVHASLRHRENLVTAMLHGYKRGEDKSSP